MSGVKLFGKTIQLPPEAVEAAEICEPADQSCAAAEDPESRLIQSGPRQDDPNEESKDPNAELDKTTLKKPDKILPCPRCNSNETKFCYFNNYNVNQPRHFCRNCQRYWTAGGTMRKVPVGAGRRKNKNILASASQFCPLTVPINHPNGTILAFNSETSEPLCESMVSVLSIVDKTVEGDDQSSGPSYSSSKDEVPVFHGPTQPYPWQNPNVQWTSAFDPAGISLPCYPAAPLPYLAGPTVWNLPFLITPAAAMSSSTLGKHPRDEEDIPTTKKESGGDDDDNLEKKCLWVPKTLRIDECGSSILTNLGIKSDTTIREDDDDDCARVGGLFKAFQCQSKGDDKTTDEETPTVLQANPAALSRSVSYHESS